MNTGTFFQPLLLTVAAELRQVAVVQPGDRVMIALALQVGLEPVDLKLVTALLLLAALALGRLRLPGLANAGKRL